MTVKLVPSNEPLDGEVISPTGDVAPRSIEVKVTSGGKERLVDVQLMGTHTTHHGTVVPPKAPITIDAEAGPPAGVTPLLQNFDPDLPLGYDAILVQHAEAIRVLGKRVVGDIIEIGQRLTDSKARCGHGRFLPWLGREFGWSEDTAERFMQVAKVFGSNSAQCAEFELPMHGLYLLAKPSTPEAARAEVIERAEAGELMTAAQIREIVDKGVAAEIKAKLKACEAELRAEYEGAGQAKIDKAVAKSTAPLQKQIEKYESKLAKIAERDEARAERDTKAAGKPKSKVSERAIRNEKAIEFHIKDAGELASLVLHEIRDKSFSVDQEGLKRLETLADATAAKWQEVSSKLASIAAAKKHATNTATPETDQTKH